MNWSIDGPPATSLAVLLPADWYKAPVNMPGKQAWPVVSLCGPSRRNL